MKKVKQILGEFIDECSKKLDLGGIIEFGSSTYLKNPQDIDLVFFSKENIFSTKSILILIEIIKDFERRYNEVVFDFGGLGDRERKAEHSITIIFLGKKEVNTEYNPHDIFFFKNLREGDSKILYGKNSFKSKNIFLTDQHLFEMLSVDQKHAIRKALDGNEQKTEAFYHLFKTFLRAMLINDGVFKKDELPRKFQENFGREIKLPKNSEKLINKKFSKNDSEEILKFTEDCLRWLVK